MGACLSVPILGLVPVMLALLMTMHAGSQMTVNLIDNHCTETPKIVGPRASRGKYRDKAWLYEECRFTWR